VVVVGAGRIGTSLAAMGPVTLVRRGEPIPALAGPVVVCTRNDDLRGVIDATPADKRADLVFVQNGLIEDLLRDQGLQDCTLGLLYFAVQSVGADPVDGGGTVLTGPWAEHLAAHLRAGGVSVTVVDRTAFRQQMLEKLLWNVVFGLLSQTHAASVGQVCADHDDQVRALTAELVGVGERALGLTLEPGVADRLIAYSREIADYRGAVKEWPWRNGWFLSQERSPIHAALCGALGLG
jgi:ketopantoate reductase